MNCPHCHGIRSPSLLAILGLLAVVSSAVVITKYWRSDRHVITAAPEPTKPRIILIDTPQTPIEVIDVVEPSRRARR